MTDFIVRASAEPLSARGRTIYGLVAPFDTWAEVYDRSGPSRPYQERIMRGAFARSIKERGHKVALVHEHQHEQTMPLGKATLLEERPEGLYGEFAVARTQRGDEALQLVAENVLTGFSIRSGVRRSTNDDRTHVTRHELALIDVSLTGSPVYETTLVGVRSRIAAPATLSTEAAMRLLAVRMKASNQ